MNIQVLFLFEKFYSFNAYKHAKSGLEEALACLLNQEMGKSFPEAR